MSAQWTQDDPGVGSTRSLASLVRRLNTVEKSLDSGLSDLRRADDVFLDQWVGFSAVGARANLAALVVRTKAYETAVSKARSAIDRYAAEVYEIKELTAVQIEKRIAAQQTLRGELVTDPGAFQPERSGHAQRAFEEALAELRALAVRRQGSDDALLAAVRAAIAMTWEIDPEGYPADRAWHDQAAYEYVITDGLGVSTADYTAEALMDLFKKYPGDIFPFEVNGSSTTFRDGAVFTLSDTIIINGLDEPYEIGDVVVTTTGTSVKFTVISDAYFDGPGSTIEFSIVEIDGDWALRKTAAAVNANQAAAFGAEWAAEQTWNVQADNFKNVIDTYGDQR